MKAWDQTYLQPTTGLTWLRVLRLALGMSIYDFAKRCQLSPSRISLIERRGLAEAEPLEVRKLASALNLPTRDITEAFMLKVDPHVLMQLAGQRFFVPCNEGTVLSSARNAEDAITQGKGQLQASVDYLERTGTP